MKPHIFLPDAEEDVRLARDYYYDVGGIELYQRFGEEFAQVIERIRENPEMYAKEDFGIRYAPLNKFPYAVMYRDLQPLIQIIAVAQHRRRPHFWQRRLS